MWYVARPFVLVPIMSPGVRNLFIGFIGTLVLLFVLAIGGSLMYVDYLRAVGRDAEDKAREKEPERGPAVEPVKEASDDPASWKKGELVRLGGTHIETTPEGGAFLDSLEGKGAITRWVVRIKVGAAEVYCSTKERPAAPAFEPGQRVSVSGEFDFRNGHVVVLKECEFR